MGHLWAFEGGVFDGVSISDPYTDRCREHQCSMIDRMVPVTRLERARFYARDFESLVSANSTRPGYDIRATNLNQLREYLLVLCI